MHWAQNGSPCLSHRVAGGPVGYKHAKQVMERDKGTWPGMGCAKGERGITGLRSDQVMETWTIKYAKYLLRGIEKPVAIER